MSTKQRNLGDILQEFSQHRQADAGGAAEGHHRPERRHRADLRRHLHPRPLPAGRRAGPGQDADGQHAGPDPRHPVQAHPVHARPDALGHHRHERAGGRRARAGATSASSKGPIFTNILLADEINRTPPKTQAALLQAMQEREVTVGQHDLSAARPVLHHRHAEPDRAGRHLSAARGPARPLHVQHQGRLSHRRRGGADSVGRPRRSEKAEVRKVLSGQAILNLQKLVSSVAVSEYIVQYVSRLVRATRPETRRRRSSCRSWSIGAPGPAPASS